MNILFLSRWCPHPVDNGSKIRVSNLLRCLCSNHAVTLVSFFEPTDTVAPADLKPLGIRDVRLIPYRPFNPFSGRAIGGFLNPLPRSIVDTRSDELEESLREVVARGRYDVVIASQIWMASYSDCFSGIPAIFEEVELGLFRRTVEGRLSMAKQIRGKLTWAKHRRFVRRLVPDFALCTVVSKQEKSLLSEAAPEYKNIHVIPNAVDVKASEEIRPCRESDSLVFTGSLQYFPNHDAMSWFLGSIYPIIKAKAERARLTITGHVGDRRLPAADGVTTTGVVPDVRPVLAASAVSIAPIRMGGGTRLKVLEAMALRTPVVATAKAVEGLEVENEIHVLVADKPGEFADAVVRLLDEPRTARRLAENAFQLVKEKYDWGSIGPHWCGLVEGVATS